MKRILLILVSLLVSYKIAFANNCKQSLKNPNVILISFDGIRQKEFLNSKLMPYFWENMAPKSYVYAKDHFTISNEVVLSLPGYQSIMSGRDTGCPHNYCGFNQYDDVANRLVESGIDPKKVAIFTSWKRMIHMVGPKPLFHLDVGLNPLGSRTPRELIIEQNKRENWPVWNSWGKRFCDVSNDDYNLWCDRADSFTFKMGLHYLKEHRPRFLYISLLDSDEWAHRKRFDLYISSIKTYDKYLEELMKTLKEMGEYGEQTTVIITTDHGRGNQHYWNHSRSYPEAKKIWLAGMGPCVGNNAEVSQAYTGSHQGIRWTIESLFGIKSRDALPALTPLIYHIE